MWNVSTHVSRHPRFISTNAHSIRFYNNTDPFRLSHYINLELRGWSYWPYSIALTNNRLLAVLELSFVLIVYRVNKSTGYRVIPVIPLLIHSCNNLPHWIRVDIYWIWLDSRHWGRVNDGDHGIFYRSTFYGTWIEITGGRPTLAHHDD